MGDKIHGHETIRALHAVDAEVRTLIASGKITAGAAAGLQTKLTDLLREAERAQVTSEPFTQGELEDAFAKVRPAENWKDRIDKVVECGTSDHRLITAAIIHFTGSLPEFIEAGEGRWRVQAAGYYEAIGS